MWVSCSEHGVKFMANRKPAFQSHVTEGVRTDRVVVNLFYMSVYVRLVLDQDYITVFDGFATMTAVE